MDHEVNAFYLFSDPQGNGLKKLYQEEFFLQVIATDIEDQALKQIGQIGIVINVSAPQPNQVTRGTPNLARHGDYALKIKARYFPLFTLSLFIDKKQEHLNKKAIKFL